MAEEYAENTVENTENTTPQPKYVKASNSVKGVSTQKALKQANVGDSKAEEKKSQFTQETMIRILNKTENQYVKENQEYALDLIQRLSIVTDEDGRYYFSQYDIKPILDIVNADNKDTLERMITPQKQGERALHRRTITYMLNWLAKLEPELQEKIIGMFASGDDVTWGEEKFYINFMKAVEEYPEEVEILTSGYSPYRKTGFFYHKSEIEELLQHLKAATPKEKEAIRILCSTKFSEEPIFGYSTADRLLQLLDSHLDMEPSQILLYFQNKIASGVYFYNDLLDHALKNMLESKGKDLFSNTRAYVKNKPMDKEDYYTILKDLGAKDDEITKIYNNECARILLQLCVFVFENNIANGVTKAEALKEILQACEADANAKDSKYINDLGIIINYLNKENFELYKSQTGESDPEIFLRDLETYTSILECRNVCQTISKITGKQIYFNDINVIGGTELSKLVKLTEEDITKGYEKIKGLGLLNDNVNIIALLARAKELNSLNETQEIKDFISYMLENEYIGETLLLDILFATQSENNEIQTKKINFAKELIGDEDVSVSAIAMISNNLSAENNEILDKQIDTLRQIAKEYPTNLYVYSKFLKTENVNELESCINLLLTAKQKENGKYITDIVKLINGTKINKKIIADYAADLYAKYGSLEANTSISYLVANFDNSNVKGYMDLYKKGLEVGLGSIKNIYDDILKVYLTDIKKDKLREKIRIYERLSEMDDDGKTVLKKIGINYDKLLEKAVNSIGAKRPLVDIPQEQRLMFFDEIISNNNAKTQKVLKEFNFKQFGKQGLPLKYTRAEFNKNVEGLIKDLDEEEAAKILRHFGLERGAAGFDGLPNDSEYKNKNASSEAIQAAKSVQAEIRKFLAENEVMIEDKEAKEILDGLIKGLPEFTSIVGKEQHGTHDYSVDIHTLVDLQYAMNDPLYETLNDRDKTILKYAIILHDLGKKGGVVDHGHASLSADYAWAILDKTKLSVDIKSRIIDIIDNHHWFEKFNMREATAEDVAVRCRRPEDSKIYKIFAKADLKGVSSTFISDRLGIATDEEFETFMQEQYDKIDEALKQIYQNANFVFDTKFYNDGRQFPVVKVQIGDKIVELNVLDFSKLEDDEDLFKYGFAPGVTKKTARFFVHVTGLHGYNMETATILTKTPVFQSTWSASLVSAENNNTYYSEGYGFIFAIPQANISEAFWGNTGSGGEKKLDNFKELLFGSRKIVKDDIYDQQQEWDVRHYVKKYFVEEMRRKGYFITDDEYSELSKYLFNLKYLTQINKDVKVGNKIIKAQDLIEALEVSRDSLFYGYQHSEIIPINPTIIGMYAKADKIEDCPQEFLEFAHKNNLPIVVMKPATVGKQEAKEIEEAKKQAASQAKIYDYDSAKAKLMELLPDEDEYTIKNLLECCMTKNELNQDLFNEALYLLGCGVKQRRQVYAIIANLRYKDGIDYNRINKLHELVNGGMDVVEAATLLGHCRNRDGAYSEEYYEKIQLIQGENLYTKHAILINCEVDGTISESRWKKVLELQTLGFDETQIMCIMRDCNIVKEDEESGEKKVIGFNEKAYEASKLLLEKYHFAHEKIPSLISKCLEEGEFLDARLARALKLQGKIAEKLIQDFVHFPDDGLDYMLDLKNRYNIKDEYLWSLINACMEKTEQGPEKYVLSPLCMEKAEELLSVYKVSPDAVWRILGQAKLNGKLDLRLYEEVLKYAKKDSNFNIYGLIDAVKAESENPEEPSFVNYALLDKAQKLVEQGYGYWDVYAIAESLQKQKLDFENRDIIQDYLDMGFQLYEIPKFLKSSEDMNAEDLTDRILELKDLGLDCDKINKTFDCLGRQKGDYYEHPLELSLSKEKLDIAIDMAKRGADPEEIGKFSRDLLDYNIVNMDYYRESHEYVKKGVLKGARIQILRAYKKSFAKQPELEKIMLELDKNIPVTEPDMFIEIARLLLKNEVSEECKAEKAVLDVIKDGVDINSLYNILAKISVNTQSYAPEDAPIANEMKLMLIETLKKYPDKADKIIEIIDCKYGFNHGAIADLQELALRLKYIDTDIDLKEGIYPFYSTTGSVQAFSSGALDLLYNLDKADVPIKDACEYAREMYNYAGSMFGTNIPPEIINKIVELHNNKILNNDTPAGTVFIDIIKRLPWEDAKVFDVIDELARLNETLVQKEELNNIINMVSYSDYNGFYIYDNYKEILDFYMQKGELFRYKDDVNDIHYFYYILRKYVGENPGMKQVNLEGFEAAAKLIESGVSLISVINCFLPIRMSENYNNLKSFVDKIDLKEYSKELNVCFDDFAADILNPSITKKELELLMDIQRLYIKNWPEGVKPRSFSPRVLEMFQQEELPDETLNRIRLYVESKFSTPFTPDSYKHIMSDDDARALVKFSKLLTIKPDGVQLLEKLLYGDILDDGYTSNYMLKNLSLTKDVLDKQLELLDLIMQYPHFEKRTNGIVAECFNSSENVEDVQAKIETYKLFIPRFETLAENLVKTIGDKEYPGQLHGTICILRDVNASNKEVVKTAFAEKYKKDQIDSLAYSTKEANAEFILKLIKDKKYSHKYITALATVAAGEKCRGDFIAKMLDDGSFAEEEVIDITSRLQENKNENAAALMCFDKKLNFPHEHIENILMVTYSKQTEDLAIKLCMDETFPRDKIAMTLELYRYIRIDDDTYINKMKQFLSFGFKEDFIRSIIGNSNTFDCYTDNFCRVLANIQAKNIKVEKCISVLTSSDIPRDLTQQIEALEILTLLAPEDIKLLEAEGINIREKIHKLQKSIDVKQPIITTSKQDVMSFLQGVVSNSGNAEDVIKTMDLSQFEKNGIPLQYSREEFMRKMNELIQKFISVSTGVTSISTKNAVIPKLELTEQDALGTKEKIEELKKNHSTTKVKVIMNGKTYDAIRFEGTQGGSNTAYYTQIGDKLYYIKYPDNSKLGQSVEEVITSQLYRVAGIDSPNMEYVYDKDGKIIGMASEYVPGTHIMSDKGGLFDSFAVDAWLENWDAPKNDNSRVRNGKCIKMDVGGSLHYRAKGELKANFGDVVEGLISILYNNSCYNDMSKAELLESIQHVIEIPNESINKVIMDSPSKDMELAETLIKRKYFIAIFGKKLEALDEKDFPTIKALIEEAYRLAKIDFENIPDVAGALGYVPGINGFEGLLNTQELDMFVLTPEQQAVVDEMKTEINKFTVENRLADDVNVHPEVRQFINDILKGVPEFAAYFGKPQHGNGKVDAQGRQISGHQYPLDIHMLKVLQKSLNNPLYEGKDEFGNDLLDSQSKIVLKFAALLHDMGKKYQNGRDLGHAELSAAYVYSVLERFNLPKAMKDRIINIVNNHHWFEDYCKGNLNAEAVATMFRTNEDFTIARIIAQADLESVRDGFFLSTMKKDFPKDIKTEKDAYIKFNKIMDEIEQKVCFIESTAPMITPSRFVEVPEIVDASGKVISERRGFDIVEVKLDGKMVKFKVLNLHKIKDNEDMYKYGFNHIKKEDLRFLVHRPGDDSRGKFDTFDVLGSNPMNTSLQSFSLISPNHTEAYDNRSYSAIIEGNISNIGVAYPSNIGTGYNKKLVNLLEEFFGSDKAGEVQNKNQKFQNARTHGFSTYDKHRVFFKKEFINYMKEHKGIEIDDRTYIAIVRYLRQKQKYPETKIKDIKIGNTIIKKEDLIDALFYAQDQILGGNKKKAHGEQDEITFIDYHVIAGGADAKSIEELLENEAGRDFLRTCRDRCDGNVILW